MKFGSSAIVAFVSLLGLVNADYGVPAEEKGKTVLPAKTDDQTEGYYFPSGSYDTADGNGYYHTGDVSEVPLDYAHLAAEGAKPGHDYYPDHYGGPTEKVPEQKPAPSYHHEKHHYPAPVYAAPKEEPKKEEPKKEEPKKEEPKKEPKGHEEHELTPEEKQKLYKANPYGYYEHDYLKPEHPKYWVKVSDYEPPKVKKPMNDWEKENLVKFTKDRIKTYLKLKDMVPIFKDWEEQENFEIGTFVDKVSVLTVISIFVAAIGTILPLWGFAVAQPPLAGRAFGGSRMAMMWEYARESFPIAPEGVDRLARTVATAVASHEQCGQRFACEVGNMVDSLPMPITRLARVATRIARTMRPEFGDMLSAFEAGTCTKFKCGSLSNIPPERVVQRVHQGQKIRN